MTGLWDRTEPATQLAGHLDEPDRWSWFRAPGRVNLIGEHTDYNDGFVLPVAVDRDCTLAIRPRDDGRVLARSLDFEGTVELAADGSTEPNSIQPTWGRLVAGVLALLAERHLDLPGAELAVTSDLPPASGLASSAALEVAVAMALADLGGAELTVHELARTCQDAEQLATGVPCGIMDQLASLTGTAGHALLTDCRSLAVEAVPIPDTLAVAVVDSGLRRDLADTPYARRREQCATAAHRVGVPTLRDAELAQVRDDPVARHVVTENTRVRAAAVALASGDLSALGQLVAASHVSLRDDFDCSTPELDSLVDLLVEGGSLGARLTGAGWGGCAVAVVPSDRVESLTRSLADHDHWFVTAVDGAGRLER